MKLFPNTINREKEGYSPPHYRAHWQPLWAIIGLVLCTLVMITQGWSAVYDLCAKSPGVSKEDSIVDLIAAYLGVSLSLGAMTDIADKSESQQRSLLFTFRTRSDTRPR